MLTPDAFGFAAAGQPLADPYTETIGVASVGATHWVARYVSKSLQSHRTHWNDINLARGRDQFLARPPLTFLDQRIDLPHDLVADDLGIAFLADQQQVDLRLHDLRDLAEVRQ